MSRWAWPFLIAAVLGASPAAAETASEWSVYCSVRVLVPDPQRRGATIKELSKEYVSPMLDLAAEDYDAPFFEWTHGAYSRSFAKAAFPNGDLPENAEHGCYVNLASERGGWERVKMRRSHIISDSIDVDWRPTPAVVDEARAYKRRQAEDEASLKPPFDWYASCYIYHDVTDSDAAAKWDGRKFFPDGPTVWNRRAYFSEMMVISSNPELLNSVQDLYRDDYTAKHPELIEALPKRYDWNRYAGTNCVGGKSRDEAERRRSQELARFPIPPIITGWTLKDADYVKLAGIVPARPSPSSAPAIVIADMNETARRASAQSARDEIVAADARARAAIGAEADRKYEAEVAQGKVRAAARLAKFRERCPSLACQ